MVMSCSFCMLILGVIWKQPSSVLMRTTRVTRLTWQFMDPSLFGSRLWEDSSTSKRVTASITTIRLFSRTLKQASFYTSQRNFLKLREKDH